LSPSGDYGFDELTTEGKQLQSNLFKYYNKVLDLLRTIFAEQTEKTKEALEEQARITFFYILLEGYTWDKSTKEAAIIAVESLDKQLSLLEGLSGFGSSNYIYVPDTNALLSNPKLESWDFPGIEKFFNCINPNHFV